MTDSTQLPPRQRVRILYEKGEAIKFISHQDEFRMWERTLRRADLPLLYKQGFNPQPHMQFASPLGVGFTGVREPIDITFSPPVPLDELTERIRAKLPPAAVTLAIEEVPLKTESLQSLLIGADYTILIYAEPGEMADDAERTHRRLAGHGDNLAQAQRKGRNYVYNLRPLVFELRYRRLRRGHAKSIASSCACRQRAGATGRPDDVVDALGLDDYRAHAAPGTPILRGRGGRCCGDGRVSCRGAGPGGRAQGDASAGEPGRAGCRHAGAAGARWANAPATSLTERMRRLAALAWAARYSG